MKKLLTHSYIPLISCIFSLILVTGCTSRPLAKSEIAKRIAAPAWMIKREIPAAPFNLTAYERIHEYNSTVNLYIGAGGETPSNPVTLHLASKDSTPNIIYLARPCQYSGMEDENDSCTHRQYSPDVMDAYNAALNEIAARYDVRGFHLIGYEGGAVIAANLAAERKDVRSFRSVAGILDIVAYHNAHGREHKGSSYNPPLKAIDLVNMPQYHFIGGQDTHVPPSVLHSYLQSFPPTHCVQYQLVQENEHINGWVEKWPALLKKPVTCYHGREPSTFNALDLIPRKEETQPSFPTIREKPSKP